MYHLKANCCSQSTLLLLPLLLLLHLRSRSGRLLIGLSAAASRVRPLCVAAAANSAKDSRCVFERNAVAIVCLGGVPARRHSTCGPLVGLDKKRKQPIIGLQQVVAEQRRVEDKDGDGVGESNSPTGVIQFCLQHHRASSGRLTMSANQPVLPVDRIRRTGNRCLLLCLGAILEPVEQVAGRQTYIQTRQLSHRPSL